MAQISEECPHCGNIVEGKKIKTYTNKVARQGAKSAVHMATSAGGMGAGATVGSIFGPLGTLVGGAVGFIGSAMFNQKVNESIDKVGDKIEDELLTIDYEFVCPKCGSSWTHKKEESIEPNIDVDEYIKGLVEQDDGFEAYKIAEIHAVVNIIADILNVDVDDICPNSDLEEELGATDSDKKEILKTLKDWFGTNPSKDYEDYFFVDDYIEEFTGESLWNEDIPEYIE